MARRPTTEEVDKAREYIRRRIDIQHHVELDIDQLLEEAAESIALVVSKYKARGMKLRFAGSSAMAREIDEILQKLKDDIDYYVFLYCSPEEASEEETTSINAYVKGEFFDSTYEQREALYLSNYRKILALIGFENMEMDEEEFISAIREEAGKIEHRIMLLAITTVGYGWMKYLLDTEGKGKSGFWVIPGSSHPCEFCVDMQSRFHPIDDPKPLYHPNCCCQIVYV